MKKYILLIFFSPLLLFAQQKDLIYAQTQDISFARNIKNNTAVDSYTTKDGFKISIGDVLTIGEAFTKREKHKYKDVFSNIVVGKVKSSNSKELRFLPYKYAGEKVVVENIFVNHEKYNGYNPLKKKQEMPLYVSVFVKTPKEEVNSIKGFKKLLSYSRKTILDIEKAMSSLEIVNPNQPLTKEEAIKKLKESKDLMELDLLSKKEYDRLKKELTPIIMNE